jgi:hypothetical protein
MVQFVDSAINIGWSPAAGALSPGRFDLGRISLSDDAKGRGAIWISGATPDWDWDSGEGYNEKFVRAFEIVEGVIRFTGPPILPVTYRGWDPPLIHLGLNEDFEPDESMRAWLSRSLEGTPLGNWIAAYTETSALPFEPLSMRIDENGRASLDLHFLSLAAINRLTETGKWRVEGSKLVFNAVSLTAVPEPRTIWVALVLAAAGVPLIFIRRPAERVRERRGELPAPFFDSR